MKIFQIRWTSTQILNGEELFDNYDLAYNKFSILRQHKETTHVSLWEIQSNPKTGLFEQYTCILEYASAGDYQFTSKETILPRLEIFERLATQNLRDTFISWQQHWNVKISYDCYKEVIQLWKQIVKKVRDELTPQIEKVIQDLDDDMDFRSDKEKEKDKQ